MKGPAMIPLSGDRLEAIRVNLMNEIDVGEADPEYGELVKALEAELARLRAETVEAQTRAHGLAQESTIRDVNAGLLDDLIAPRLAPFMERAAAAEADWQQAELRAEQAEAANKEVEAAIKMREDAIGRAEMCAYDWMTKFEQAEAARAALIEEAATIVEQHKRGKWDEYSDAVSDIAKAIRALRTP